MTWLRRACGLFAVLVLLPLLGTLPAASAAVTYLCTGYAGCTSAGYGDFGYGAASGTSYWGMAAGHNCTNYAAYRLIQAGIDASYLRGQGMAYQWGTVAAAHGVPVDGTPRVGDIAWWAGNSNGMGADGHVAYVQEVGAGYIVLSEDAWGGNFDWVRLTPGSYYPTAFIHFAGLPAGAPGTYRSLLPSRILDTRTGVGAPAHAVASGGTVRLKVAGVGGVPASGVSAVTLTVTVTQPQTSGHIRVYPDGIAAPNVSNVNFVAGQDVANSVVVPVGTGGYVDLLNVTTGGTTHVVADVMGWFAAGSPGQPGTFGAVTPTRILDSRVGTGMPGGTARPLDPGETLPLAVTGLGGVPASGVSAVVLNVTATQAETPGYVTIYPDGIAQPTVSSLNVSPGADVPNLVIAPVGAGGVIDLVNGSNGGTTHLIADVYGYFTAGTPTSSGALATVSPSRILDTRSGAPVAPGARVRLKVAGAGGLPVSGVSAVVLNVTATQPQAAGYVTAYPDGPPAPTSSNLNFLPGGDVPDLVILPVWTNGYVDLLNGSSGSTHLIADVIGYVTS